MPRQDLLTLIIRLVIGFIILAILAYFLFSRLRRQPTPSPTPSPTETPVTIITPTPTPSPTLLPEVSERGIPEPDDKGKGQERYEQHEEKIIVREKILIIEPRPITIISPEDTIETTAQSGGAWARAAAGDGWAEAQAGIQ